MYILNNTTYVINYGYMIMMKLICISMTGTESNSNHYTIKRNGNISCNDIGSDGQVENDDLKFSKDHVNHLYNIGGVRNASIDNDIMIIMMMTKILVLITLVNNGDGDDAKDDHDNATI